MPSTKCERKSYTTHFLKSRGSVIRIIFLNTELNKPHFLCDEMIFMHCSPQIKQNMHTLGIIRASVVIQFIVKV